MFDSAESEANAALVEHRDRVGWPSSVASVSEAQPAQSIDYALRRDSDLRSDPSLAWLAEVMRHAPQPEHAMPYGAYMQTVRELMQHVDALKAVKAALADARREYDELVREHAAAMDVEQAKRQIERGEMLHELGKLHDLLTDLLTVAGSYVTDALHLSDDPEQRARVRKLLHEIGKAISPTLTALPNDGE